MRVKRANYLCLDCHKGRYPLDEQLEFCAGGLSAGLEESAALKGARAVLKARAAYLGGQWDDFWHNRPFRPRAYRRQSAQETRLAA